MFRGYMRLCVFFGLRNSFTLFYVLARGRFERVLSFRRSRAEWELRGVNDFYRFLCLLAGLGESVEEIYARAVLVYLYLILLG